MKTSAFVTMTSDFDHCQLDYENPFFLTVTSTNKLIILLTNLTKPLIIDHCRSYLTHDLHVN